MSTSTFQDVNVVLEGFYLTMDAPFAAELFRCFGSLQVPDVHFLETKQDYNSSVVADLANDHELKIWQSFASIPMSFWKIATKYKARSPAPTGSLDQSLSVQHLTSVNIKLYQCHGPIPISDLTNVLTAMIKSPTMEIVQFHGRPKCHTQAVKFCDALKNRSLKKLVVVGVKLAGVPVESVPELLLKGLHGTLITLSPVYT